MSRNLKISPQVWELLHMPIKQAVAAMEALQNDENDWALFDTFEEALLAVSDHDTECRLRWGLPVFDELGRRLMTDWHQKVCDFCWWQTSPTGTWPDEVAPPQWWLDHKQQTEGVRQ